MDNLEKGMKVIIALIVWLGGLGIGCLAIGVAQAQEQASATMSITPNTVALAPGEIAQTWVIATIPMTNVQSITLTAFSEAGVEVAIDKPIRSGSSLWGDLVWTVTITRLTTGRPTGSVQFLAEYRKKEGNGQVVPGTLTTSLTIQERLPKTIDQVVTANIESSLETLQDRQSQQAFVVVKNLSNIPVKVTGITAAPIPRITTAVEKLGNDGFQLEPQQSYPFSMTLRAGDAVQSGKHLLVVRVDVTWEEANQQTAGSLVLDKEFNAGVFGESAILEATSIPSLMLLPGFLFVTALILLTQWAWGKSPLKLDFKEPAFWFVAVTVSLFTLWFYPWITTAIGPILSWLTGIPISTRDYFQAYGFTDIFLLWVFALTSAIVLWAGVSSLILLGSGIVEGIQYLRRRREQQQRALLNPKEGDAEIMILRKISHNQTSFDLQEVSFLKDRTNKIFKLPAGFPEPGKVWIAPRIVIHWRKRDGKLRAEVEELKNDVTKVRPLLEKLETLLDPADPIVELKWQTGLAIDGPKLVDEDEIEEVSPSDPFIT